MIYLFGAFLILWAITFGYILNLHARQKRLYREWERFSRIGSPSEDCQSSSQSS